MSTRRLRQDADNRVRAWHLSRRVLVDGRLVAPGPDVVHGQRSTYTKRGCHCVPCTGAERRYRAEYRAELRLDEQVAA